MTDAPAVAMNELLTLPLLAIDSEVLRFRHAGHAGENGAGVVLADVVAAATTPRVIATLTTQAVT